MVGIRAKWSGGTWKWYARRRVGSVEEVGPLRDTQEQAFEDYLAKKKAQSGLPKKVLTLMDGLAVVIDDARRRGLPETTIERQLKSHGKYLCLQFGADTKLTRITPKEVEAFVARALKGIGRNQKPTMGRGGKPSGPRSAATINGKDLQLLGAIFKAARLESPVPLIRNRPRKPKRRKIDPFKIEDVKALLIRMREEEFLDKNGDVLHLPAREYHADLVEFMVATGIRSGELTRLTVRDVNFRARAISIIAKDRANPRSAYISDGLRPVVKRIVAYAKAHNDGRFVPTGVAYLANMFKAWQRRLDEPRLNGRRLRQTAITSVIESGAPLLDAKDFAGHTKIDTTALYVEAVENRQAAIAEQHHRRLHESSETEGSPSQNEGQEEEEEAA